MSVLTLASDPQDATALEGAEAHHARLAGELAGRVKNAAHGHGLRAGRR
ncbi:hypothetical protein NFX46_21135 [Streptomyces phaeoluteigriseus]|uniref:Uncharacterized protein n=1 Tax=Streptomyces phaeoluteigriseus TaxID=114686 RepID=A0ABY4ZAE0_9ACTN|nr:hypothetical protein [Streptomyces phaeoluteigriseus]USQ86002.1 hypothetical protein NFX46_21135 [Streptomyces phaeoluteigriseus]